MTTTETKWEAAVFADNRPASDHVSYRITPQRGPYGTMFAEAAFKAAAAPELYEAAKLALHALEYYDEHNEAMMAAPAALLAALAKARGE